MKSPTKLDASQKRLLTFASLTALLVVVARWVCLFAVLQPHKWGMAANLARWGWSVFIFYTILIVALGLLARKFTGKKDLTFKSISVRNYVGYFLGLFTLGALLLGHLNLALASSGLWSFIGALCKLRSGPDETKGETKGFTWFHSLCTLLSSALLIAALQFHSLPIAIGLLAVDIIQGLVALPGMPERMAIEAMNARQKKPVLDGTQTNFT